MKSGYNTCGQKDKKKNPAVSNHLSPLRHLGPLTCCWVALKWGFLTNKCNRHPAAQKSSVWFGLPLVIYKVTCYTQPCCFFQDHGAALPGPTARLSSLAPRLAHASGGLLLLNRLDAMAFRRSAVGRMAPTWLCYANHYLRFCSFCGYGLNYYNSAQLLPSDVHSAGCMCAQCIYSL